MTYRYDGANNSCDGGLANQTVLFTVFSVRMNVIGQIDVATSLRTGSLIINLLISIPY
jgi:hypothetical protein